MYNVRTVFAGVALAGAITVGLAATSAQAADLTTFLFRGDCTDCVGVGLGTLVLQNYTPGVQTSANFVSFNYTSSIVPSFSVTPSSLAAFHADFSNLPGEANFQVLGILYENGADHDPTGYLGLSTGSFATTLLPSVPDENNPIFFGDWILLGVIGFGTGISVNDDFGPHFSWSMVSDAVPEPGAWILMISGLGLAGAQLRARRRRSFV